MDRVQKGDGGEWQVFARAQTGGDWWMVADVGDKVAYATFGPGALYLLSRLGAPHGQVRRLALQPGATVAHAVGVVPEADVTIEGPAPSSNAEGGLAVTDTWLWVLDMDGGWSSLRLFGLDGRPARPSGVPPSSAVGGLTRLDGNEVAYATESFTEPRPWWRASGDSAARRTALAARTPLDFSGLEVRREFATSLDGTRVPVTLITPQGTPRDGTAPALLTGYGGYGISLRPRFDPSWLLWLDQGGVLAVAHTRGGGSTARPGITPDGSRPNRMSSMTSPRRVCRQQPPPASQCFCVLRREGTGSETRWVNGYPSSPTSTPSCSTGSASS